MTGLKDKIIIVTGGSSGVGRASAIIFAAQGARVIIGDMNQIGGEETVAIVRAQGGDAFFAVCDVSREDDVAKLVSSAVSRYGKLDGAFNNAGVAPSFLDLHDVTLEQFNRNIGVNLTGVFLCMKHEIAAMLKSGGGSIVNTSSVAGVVGLRLHTEYAAAKHGVIGLTKVAAIEYGKQRIRVNAVLPGGVRTPMITSLPDADKGIEQAIAMHPIGRIGEPHEIGDVAAWLLSDSASFVTGSCIAADGGFTAV